MQISFPIPGDPIQRACCSHAVRGRDLAIQPKDEHCPDCSDVLVLFLLCVGPAERTPLAGGG